MWQDSLGTNQYGLTMDTVTTFELVLPNGTLKGVTEKGENLWFALRVGPTVSLNNRNVGLTVISRGDLTIM
jgi:hypothetical protein